MAWLFQVDFQQGAGWVDITDLVLIKSFRIRETLWNNLKPTGNTCSFRMRRDTSFITSLLTVDDDILFNCQFDSTDRFTGFIRKNFDITVSSQIQDLHIECVDRTYLLKKKINTTFEYEDYEVSDTGDTGSSIVHCLLDLAGIDSGDMDPDDIAETIDYYNNIEGDQTYEHALTQLLFEFGYTYYFNGAGEFKTYNFCPTDTSTSKEFGNTSGNKNIIGNLNIKKKLEQYEAVFIKFWTVLTLTDVIVFQDTTGGDDFYKCKIPIAASDSYPEGSESHAVYGEYSITDREIISVSSISSDLTKDSNITEHTLTNKYKRCQMRYDNGGGSTEYIYKLDIIGTAVVKDQLYMVKRFNVVDTEKILNLEAKFIRTEADAVKLAVGIANFYKYSDFRYTLTSKTDYAIGDFVDIDEDDFISINNRCVIIDKVTRLISGIDGDEVEEYDYILTGIQEYSVETTSTEGSYNQPQPFNQNQIGQTDTLLLLQDNILLLSYTGTNIASPAEGDHRIYVSEGAVISDTYTNGAWSNVRRSTLFGFLGTVASFLMACGGMYHPDFTPTNSEFFPGHSYRVFDFENDYEDQNGVDDWDSKTNLAFDSSEKKFGSYSLFATSGNEGHLYSDSGGVAGDSQSIGAWVKVAVSGTASDLTYITLINYLDDPLAVKDAIVVSIRCENGESDPSIYIAIKKDEVLEIDYEEVCAVPSGWFYFGLVYDSDTDKLYIIVNNTKYDMGVVGGTWNGDIWEYIMIGTANEWVDEGITWSVYIDDLTFSYNEYIDPDLLLQHYDSGLAWNTNDGFGAKDLNFKASPFQGWISFFSQCDFKNQITISGASRVIVTKDDAQSIPDSTVTVIQYDDEEEDNLNEYDNSSNYRFTAEKAGTYLIIAACALTSSAWNAGEYAYLSVFVNGSDKRKLNRIDFDANITNAAPLSGSAILKLDAEDYVDIRIYHNRGAATNTTTTVSYNYLMIHRLS